MLGVVSLLCSEEYKTKIQISCVRSTHITSDISMDKKKPSSTILKITEIRAFLINTSPFFSEKKIILRKLEKKKDCEKR